MNVAGVQDPFGDRFAPMAGGAAGGVEFIGVLFVGTLSLLWPAGFPDASVRSD